jgi:CarD family transcriptional regulator
MNFRLKCFEPIWAGHDRSGTGASGMTFQVGEKVVYPNHGVATIENISSRAFAGNLERFYLLKITYSSLTVMVPFSHVGELRLRRVTRNGEMARVVNFLSEGRCTRYHDWKDRFKDNTEKMRDGSLLAVAEVLKSLLVLQTQKVLSFREKKMLDRARHMLITEFSTSRGLSQLQATDMLQKALQKAQLNLPEPL